MSLLPLSRKLASSRFFIDIKVLADNCLGLSNSLWGERTRSVRE